MPGSSIASGMPWKRKQEYLESFSEDDFRDKVVRPLYERFGFRFVSDTCGPEEMGRDCIFLSTNNFGETVITAVQTKKGPISTSGSSTTKSVQVATQQLQLARDAILDIPSRNIARKPNEVHLCISGRLSNTARQHISRTVSDPSITLYDSEDLIGRIDDRMPEFWLGIDCNRVPYLNRLCEEIHRASDTLRLSDSDESDFDQSPSDDEAYVPVFATRIIPKVDERLRHGKIVPKFDDVPVDRLLAEKKRHTLLLGDGGAGKTTAIRRMALKECQAVLEGKPASIPVILTAREVAASALPLVELADAQARRIAGQDNSVFDTDDLRDGRVALFVDGLDEADSDERGVAIPKILDFMADYGKCAVVVAARDYRSIVTNPLLQSLQHYRLIPISLRQAEKLIEVKSRTGKVDRRLAKELLRRLQDVHGLHLSPMLVTVFLASADFSKSDLAPNISEIFKKFTELMLGRWDLRRGLKQQHHAPTKDLLLQKVAFSMHQQKQTRIALSEFQNMLSEEIARRDLEIDSDTCYDEIVSRSGLLVIEDGFLKFRHHMIQEFFAGRGVPDDDFVVKNLADDWWRVAFVFRFGDKPDSFPALRRTFTSFRYVRWSDLFEAAITTGLACQACYWATSAEKVEAFRWVVNSLALSLDDFASDAAARATNEHPLLSFVYSYMLGRDAVGTKAIARVDLQSEEDELFDGADATNEAREFWLLTGLIESDQIAEFEQRLPKFKPTDRRFKLAVLLGLHFYRNVRCEDKAEAKRIDRIISDLEEETSDFRTQLMTEFRSLLLEIRRGELSAIEMPASEKSAAD